jgi:hypothetical protein
LTAQESRYARALTNLRLSDGEATLSATVHGTWHSICSTLPCADNLVEQHFCVIFISHLLMNTERIVAFLLKASREPLLGNGSVNAPVARRWLSSRHITAAADTHGTIEELLEVVFSVRSEPCCTACFRCSLLNASSSFTIMQSLQRHIQN